MTWLGFWKSPFSINNTKKFSTLIYDFSMGGGGGESPKTCCVTPTAVTQYSLVMLLAVQRAVTVQSSSTLTVTYSYNYHLEKNQFHAIISFSKNEITLFYGIFVLALPLLLFSMIYVVASNGIWQCFEMKQSCLQQLQTMHITK